MGFIPERHMMMMMTMMTMMMTMTHNQRSKMGNQLPHQKPASALLLPAQ